MGASLARDARPRWRGVITTALLVMITIMIVRDILVRRWGGPTPPPASDITQPSR
jgi:hypothetical protein